MPIPVIPRLVSELTSAGQLVLALSILIVLGMASQPISGERTLIENRNTPEAGMSHLASANTEQFPGPGLDSAPAHPAIVSKTLDQADLLLQARQMIAACQKQYEGVRDYTCRFYKRERIDGRLTPQFIMDMKVSTQPLSIYLKLEQPKAGREAIWVADRNQGRLVVHDVGIAKLLVGTLYVDPKGSFAMENCRHPITEAGIGNLINTLASHWEKELVPGTDTRVSIDLGQQLGDRPCTLIETTHPIRDSGYMFYAVKLYIDRELNLPIRIEAYDWPRQSGLEPELVEEYSYADLRLNVGLTENDFDHTNVQYSFGRF